MAAEKNRKNRKEARTKSTQALNARQIQLRDEKRQKAKDRKEMEENRQLAEPQNQADFQNNPPVIEITPEPQTPMPMLEMPDISFINEPTPRQNVVRAFVVSKQENRRERMAVSGQTLPAPDPFNRRSFRPRQMGFKPVIPVEASPAKTVEKTASSDSNSTQENILELDDTPVDAPPAKRFKTTASSDSDCIQAEIEGLVDIPVAAAPAETVEMTPSSDSHGTQAENEELDDITVEAPPAKRFKMTTSSDSHGIQAEIVGLDHIQVETVIAETVEITAYSSDLVGTHAQIVELDHTQVKTSNAPPRDPMEIEHLNDIIPDDSDLDSFPDDEFNPSLDPADASLTENLNDFISTYGLQIDETCPEFDTIEEMDVD